jgi:hypothetical protein
MGRQLSFAQNLTPMDVARLRKKIILMSNKEEILVLKQYMSQHDPICWAKAYCEVVNPARGGRQKFVPYPHQIGLVDRKRQTRVINKCRRAGVSFIISLI